MSIPPRRIFEATLNTTDQAGNKLSIPLGRFSIHEIHSIIDQSGHSCVPWQLPYSWKKEKKLVFGASVSEESKKLQEFCYRHGVRIADFKYNAYLGIIRK